MMASLAEEIFWMIRKPRLSVFFLSFVFGNPTCWWPEIIGSHVRQAFASPIASHYAV